MKVKVINGSLNVRKEANTCSDIVNVLADGEVVAVTSTKDGWHKVAGGYIMEKYTEVVEEKAPAAKKTATTKK